MLIIQPEKRLTCPQILANILISTAISKMCSKSFENENMIQSDSFKIFDYGELNNEKKNGIGVMDFKDKNICCEELKDDKINGKGVKHFPNGDKYDGQLKEEKMNGKGVYYDTNGDRYEGEWKNDKKKMKKEKSK